MRFIGDVHAKFDRYERLIAEVEASVQVGDFGVGFPDTPYPQRLPPGHVFLRGNHDSPAVCRAHPSWLPDGTVHQGMFVLGGALSVDRNLRVEGVDWWPDEELSVVELNRVLDAYEAERPQVVVTHDCPSIVPVRAHRGKDRHPSRTVQCLDAMLEIHRPALWIFGHHHRSLRQRIGGVDFVALDELEVFDLDMSDLQSHPQTQPDTA